MRTKVLKIALLFLIATSFSVFFQNAGIITPVLEQAFAQQGDGNGGPPPHREHKRSPPEAVAACEVQNVGEVCSFDSPRGDLILGTCEHVRDGSLACVPEGAHPGGPGGDRPPEPE